MRGMFYFVRLFCSEDLEDKRTLRLQTESFGPFFKKKKKLSMRRQDIFFRTYLIKYEEFCVSRATGFAILLPFKKICLRLVQFLDIQEFFLTKINEF